VRFGSDSGIFTREQGGVLVRYDTSSVSCNSLSDDNEVAYTAVFTCVHCCSCGVPQDVLLYHGPSREEMFWIFSIEANFSIEAISSLLVCVLSVFRVCFVSLKMVPPHPFLQDHLSSSEQLLKKLLLIFVNIMASLPRRRMLSLVFADQLWLL
jgi:hypothetical protein